MGVEQPPYKLPDWKQYKVDGIKELEWTRNALAAKGLKDPWLRNEVWRYDPKNWPGYRSLITTQFRRGFPIAAGLMVVTIGIDKAFGISASKHGGHH